MWNPVVVLLWDLIAFEMSNVDVLLALRRQELSVELSERAIASICLFVSCNKSIE